MTHEAKVAQNNFMKTVFLRINAGKSFLLHCFLGKKSKEQKNKNSLMAVALGNKLLIWVTTNKDMMVVKYYVVKNNNDNRITCYGS